MTSKIILLFFGITFIAAFVYGEQCAGVTVPDSLNTKSATLILNGAGIRTKWGFKIYVGGLYLTKKNGNADSIINADEQMAVRLHFISGLVTSEKLETSIREGFERAVKDTAAALQKKINDFVQVFTEKVNKNDVYDLVYTPGSGTAVFRNGSLISTTEGLDFKKALFGIWLGDQPAHKKLKESMLGIK